MSATYRNTFSLLQHFCTQHPVPPIHPIRLETFVTCSQNSPTLNYFRPPSRRGGTERQLSESWRPMRKTCPTALRASCAHTRACPHIHPPHQEERDQEAQLLHPAPAPCWQRYTLNQGARDCGYKPKHQLTGENPYFPSLPHVLSF